MNAMRWFPGSLSTKIVVAAIGGSVLVGAAVSRPHVLRAVVAATLIIGVVGLALRLPTGAVLGSLVVWLTALGVVRRVLSLATPADAFGDPLLVVAAFAWATLTILAVRRGALDHADGLTLAVLSLAGLFALSIVNPIQGGLTVGLAGAFQVLVPMSAFIVGRGLLSDRQLDRLLWLVMGLGAVAAAYGLYQNYVGFPLWDQQWIDTSGYTALKVSGVTRPFSVFTAASDYSQFLGIALVACVVRIGKVRWSPLSTGAGVLIVVALWNSAVRSSFILAVVGLLSILAALLRWPMRRMVVLIVVSVIALPTLVRWVVPEPAGTDAAAALSRHQYSGLTDPLGEDSTFQLHFEGNKRGLKSAITDPIGRGIGATQIAANKYGGVTASGEGDIGRIPSAVGLPGLVAYLCILSLGLTKAYRVAVKRRDPTALAALGILMVTLMGWTNGGQYAVMFWPWLLLGWLAGDPLRRQAVAAGKAVRGGIST